MEKTVILVVDRDDDFGEKGGVSTPAIGIDACMAAATALAVADPEDSDTNALFAAINIYREMEKSRPAGTFDIALICGDKQVGIHSDQVLIEEFDKVVEDVQPKGAVLVGDGAEDEYIYPVISSRLHIDSVRKVYVKQAPGVEGTMYILGKYLKDPEKKKRFIAPLAFVLIAISVMYLIANALVYPALDTFFLNSTSVLIAIIIATGVLWYCYDVSQYIDVKLKAFRGGFKDGTTLITVTLAVLFFVFGIIIGIYALDATYTYRTTQRVILFAANALWPVLFAVMFLHLGNIASTYVNKGDIRYSSVLGCISVIGTGLVATGFLDFLLEYVAVFPSGSSPIMLEFIIGFVILAIDAGVLMRVRRSAVPQEE